VATLCAYEVAAIFTDLPTLSTLSYRHPWLKPALIGVLVGHLYTEVNL
jgi:hypothetical protein